MSDSQRKNILLFGGTTEGRQMARKLSELGFSVTVCVATPTGEDYLKEIPGLRILTGRKDEAQMAEVMEDGYWCCIDATHPYAVMATSEIRKACEKTHLSYYRLLRKEVSSEELKRAVEIQVQSFLSACPASDPAKRYRDMKLTLDTGKSVRDAGIASDKVRSVLDSAYITTVAGVKEACALIMDRHISMHMNATASRNVNADAGVDASEDASEDASVDVNRNVNINVNMNVERSADGVHSCRNILLTTGAREAACFAPLLKTGDMNVFIRVLPVASSFELCTGAGFSSDRILSGWGPYTTQENVRVMRTHSIDTLVTKDGGIEGGYPEKLAAACLCGAQVIVIQRPKEAGLSEDELLERITV